MKGTITIHDPGNSQGFVLRVSEFEDVCFPVRVKQVQQNVNRVIRSCRHIVGRRFGKNDGYSDNFDDLCHRVYIDI